MPQRSRVAIALACIVFAYSSLATFLECGTHRNVPEHATQGHHGHGTHAGHGGHHDGAGAPTSHRAAHPGGTACCHASLYNVVFQSVSPVQGLRSDAFARSPLGLTCDVAAPAAGMLAPGAVHLATGPPGRSGVSGSPFSARAIFLALSSFLV